MSIAVPLEELAAAVAELGPHGFLMSAGDGGRPRINHVAFEVVDGGLRAPIGRRTAAALTARPLVSCLWPAVEPGGMSLIADGEATLRAEGDAVVAHIAVTWAVRHRPPGGGSAA